MVLSWELQNLSTRDESLINGQCHLVQVFKPLAAYKVTGLDKLQGPSTLYSSRIYNSNPAIGNPTDAVLITEVQ